MSWMDANEKANDDGQNHFLCAVFAVFMEESAAN
jgi:hypothetical protein